jgi:mannose-1-phosphate guanylyltransferase/mannose-6-phosphate isomerase
VAPRALAVPVKRELPRLRSDRLVIEPSPRDTAPAIALACVAIARREPNAIAAILPTDHVIRDEPAFVTAVGIARRAATTGALVCLGVKPDRPATGFGYLKIGTTPRRGGALPVLRFVEKPDAARARRFVKSGRYLWNGGMFVWSTRCFLDELSRVAPDVAMAATAAVAGSRRAWDRLARASVDHAVMEKAGRVAVVPLDAGWDDVGSWDAAARLTSRARSARRDHVVIDSNDSVVFGGTRLVALLGVAGVVVVDTPDALLIASRSSGEAMRDVVRAVREAGREDLL